MDSKDTNPKEAVGDKKVAFFLNSAIASAHWAAAQIAGMRDGLDQASHLPRGNHAGLVEHVGEHTRVCDLTAGQYERECAGLPVAHEVDLRRQTAP